MRTFGRRTAAPMCSRFESASDLFKRACDDRDANQLAVIAPRNIQSTSAPQPAHPSVLPQSVLCPTRPLLFPPYLHTDDGCSVVRCSLGSERVAELARVTIPILTATTHPAQLTAATEESGPMEGRECVCVLTASQVLHASQCLHHVSTIVPQSLHSDANCNTTTNANASSDRQGQGCE